MSAECARIAPHVPFPNSMKLAPADRGSRFIACSTALPRIASVTSDIVGFTGSRRIRIFHRSSGSATR
jgi:hypothetical protein